MFKRLRAVAAVTVAALLLSAGTAAVQDSEAAPRGHLLLFNFALAHVHLSIPHGTEVLRNALIREGYDVTVSANPADMTPERLANTDAVIWLSTTGNGEAPFSPGQRQAFEDWMGCGGGNVGIHAVVGPPFTGWPAWTKLWGVAENGEPLTPTSSADDRVAPSEEGWGQHNAIVKVDDHTSRATAPWQNLTAFQMRDEWYRWGVDPAKVVPGFHQLLGFAGLTSASTGARYTPGYWYDMPLAWTGTYSGTNRTFYTNLGHSVELFDDPRFIEHVLGGVEHVAAVRPDTACLFAHGMARTEQAATLPGVAAAPPVVPSPTPGTGSASCTVIGQGEYGEAAHGTDPAATWKASFYGGLGECNGQPGEACAFGTTQLCGDPGSSGAGIEAGKYYIDPATDLRYQEPLLEGAGPCETGNASGVALVTWADHGVTVVSLSTTAGQVSGEVLDSISLAPLPGQRDAAGQPVTQPLVVKTNKFAGRTVVGSLVFGDCQVHGFDIPYIASTQGDQVEGALALVAPPAGASSLRSARSVR